MNEDVTKLFEMCGMKGKISVKSGQLSHRNIAGNEQVLIVSEE